MKHILEFAKFNNLKNDIYYERHNNGKYRIYSYTMVNAMYSNSEIILSFIFNAVYHVEIIFNVKEFSIEIEYYDEFVLDEDSQKKLINNILNNIDILDEIEEFIFNYAPSTSIEEFKELLKKPKIIIYES